MSANNPYNSGNVPYGSRVEELFNPAGATQGNYITENINLTRPGKVLTRPDELGAPNGWVLTKDFPTGTAVVQVATSATVFPQLGWYFEDDFGSGSERWVITNISQPFEMQGYFKMNVNLQLDPVKANSAPA